LLRDLTKRQSTASIIQQSLFRHRPRYIITRKTTGDDIDGLLTALLEIDTLDKNVKTKDDGGKIVAEADFVYEQEIRDKALKASVIFGERTV
jgi:hypothetical protein